MTDENKDGKSNSDASGSKSEDAKNKTVKMTMDEALANLEQEKILSKDKDSLIGDLTSQLKEANDFISGQRKSKLITEILARSSFKMDELVGKTEEELTSIRATLDQAMLPHVNSARCGVMAVDLSDREKGLTVGDLSKVTAQKRKAAQGAA